MPEHVSDLSLYEHKPVFLVNNWNCKTSRFQYLI